MNKRFARTLAEAFPDERFCAVTRYRAPLRQRWWRALSWLLCLGTCAAIGVLLAWRG